VCVCTVQSGFDVDNRVGLYEKVIVERSRDVFLSGLSWSRSMSRIALLLKMRQGSIKSTPLCNHSVWLFVVFLDDGVD